MQLSKNSLQAINTHATIDIPGDAQFELPEKVLQFGTGVLLRGLPDFFIDKANKQGLFSGRIVVVKSTDSGGADAFAEQDGLYTQCIRGIEQGKVVDEYVINASISRVVSAKTDWQEILEFARNPSLRLVISNTTELGIVPGDDKVTDAPPATFPGKLLAVLYERFKALGATAASGLVIVPTELIVDNGRKLKAIVLENAQKNNLENDFIQWVENENHFCNSLVDRIVPGKLESADEKQTTALLGYQDDLKFMSEVFRLWAIESGSTKVKEVLSFAEADEGVVIAADIERFRELKLRLLNGTHTFSCGLALLAGFETVKEAMADEAFENYIAGLTKKEIAPVLEKKGISYDASCTFADQVIERFKNPYLDHKWISISFAYTSKMLMRNLPLIKAADSGMAEEPSAMALGFAAYLLLMKSRKNGDHYEREINGTVYRLNDDKAALLAALWEKNDEAQIVNAVLASKELWGEDWSSCTLFASQVRQWLSLLLKDGAIASLNKFATIAIK
ncbi:altronate oxidoreductase [Niabella ginsenosidivorans]|uniref:Altronate oxidoreductase n=1 Tax=Niabella ginsenosidivorans TaxID=1176587 RepID=A0A1A9I7A7_9BACT|nr:tagaturonate reductase [Niabella ginsenosidivorans]ANH82590.1 altronate oxidoreductase [Niabella ginsenosidivorans]